ncbi:MAG: hypothetical protein ACOC5T_01145 [Elusimicrobiota bacterium]
MVEVFAGYETIIELAPSIEKDDNFEISDDTEVEINNQGNKAVFPRFEFIATDTFTLDSIEVDDVKVSFDNVELSENDELVLDFADQIYELEGNDIIEDISFDDDDRIYLLENDKTTIQINATGEADLTVYYSGYDIVDRLHFVEEFRIEKVNNYEQKMSFSKSHPSDYDYVDSEYSFNIRKLSTDWIEDDKKYRIMYHEENPDTLEENLKYLIGAVFTDYRRGYNQPDGILADRLTGEAIKILDKKV